MRNLLYIFLLSIFCFINKSATAQITLTVSVNALSAGSGVTSSSVNTTGANGILVAETYRPTEGPSFSDNKSSTWNICTKYEGTGNQSGVTFYYCSPCNVGSGHTFSTSNHFGSISVFAFSGMRTATSPLDQQNGQWNVSAPTSFQPGSITPTVNGCVVLTVVMTQAGTQPTLPSGYAGFTWPTATAFAGGAGYKIQTTATSENPTWTIGSGANAAVSVVDFMPPGTTTTTNGGFFINMIRQ